MIVTLAPPSSSSSSHALHSDEERRCAAAGNAEFIRQHRATDSVGPARCRLKSAFRSRRNAGFIRQRRRPGCGRHGCGGTTRNWKGQARIRLALGRQLIHTRRSGQSPSGAGPFWKAFAVGNEPLESKGFRCQEWSCGSLLFFGNWSFTPVVRALNKKSISVILTLLLSWVLSRAQVYSVAVYAGGTSYRHLCSFSIPFFPYHELTERSWYEDINGLTIIDVRHEKAPGDIFRRVLDVNCASESFTVPLEPLPAKHAEAAAPRNQMQRSRH